MLKTAIFAASILLTSTAALAEIKGLSCSGTEPFWSVDIDVAKSTMTYTSPDDLKGTTYKTNKPSHAFGMSDDMIMVVKSSKRDISATVLAATLTGQACSDGMSEHDYAFHVVYRNGSKVFYGCCDSK